MNCKPGDLAIVVGSSRYSGMLVTVLYAAPSGRLILPDGYPSINQCSSFAWVLESMSGLFWCPNENGAFLRYAKYGVGSDSKLRPIRDQPGTDEMIRIAGKPNKEKVDG